MKKKILCIFTIILTILAGCAKEEKSNIEVSDDEVGIEIMEGMNYLVAGNDYGFYFDVYSKSGDKKIMIQKFLSIVAMIICTL